jgi:hypothetical protein
MGSAHGLSLGLVIAALMSARPACAVGPVDIEVAGKVNYGFGGGGYGLGVGGRAGVSFAGFYAGMSVVDYPARPVVLDSSPIYTVGGEVGYGIKIASFTIRPLLGVGYWNESQSPCQFFGPASVPTPSCTTTALYLEPGLVLAVSVWPILVGFSASALVLAYVHDCTELCPDVQSGATAFLIGGQAGARF